MDDMEDHTLLDFAAPVPSPWSVPVPPPSRQRPQRQIRPDCELGHGGYFIAVLILILTAAKIQAAVHKDLDDDSEMWKIFLDKVKEEDSRFTDAWKEDANSIVVFVSLN